MPLTTEEIEEIKKGCKIEFVYPKGHVMGGQHCGIIIKDCVLTHEDLNFEIRIGHHRSQIKNRELCIQLFELFLSTLN